MMFFHLTSSKVLNVEDSLFPFHVEKGSSFSKHQRLLRDEVEKIERVLTTSNNNFKPNQLS